MVRVVRLASLNTLPSDINNTRPVEFFFINCSLRLFRKLELERELAVSVSRSLPVTVSARCRLQQGWLIKTIAADRDSLALTGCWASPPSLVSQVFSRHSPALFSHRKEEIITTLLRGKFRVLIVIVNVVELHIMNHVYKIGIDFWKVHIPSIEL